MYVRTKFSNQALLLIDKFTRCNIKLSEQHWTCRALNVWLKATVLPKRGCQAAKMNIISGILFFYPKHHHCEM